MKNWEFLSALELPSSSNEKSPTPEFVQREIYNSRLRQSKNTNSQVRPCQHKISEFNSSLTPSWSPSLATTTRMRWSTVCWTQLRRRVQTLNLKIRLNSRTISSFRLYAFAFVKRHIHHNLLLPTPSITMYAGPKQWLLISVFRAQHSFSSFTRSCVHQQSIFSTKIMQQLFLLW